MLTAERLRRLYHYDPETGVMTRNMSGNPVRRSTRDGYLVVTIDRRNYAVHRLAWLYVHGHWPAHEIDHINGNKDDNRLVNLRDVTRRVNAQNLRAPLPNKVKNAPLGVSWQKDNKWRAMIWDGTKNKYLGRFDTPEAAHAAYVAAKRRLHQGCTL